MRATAAMVILPFSTNEPSGPTASTFGVRYAHTISRNTRVISSSERSASLTRSDALSAASASTIISFMPASPAPTNDPAMPGANAQSAQKPAETPNAMYSAFITAFFSCFSFMTLSSA